MKLGCKWRFSALPVLMDIKSIPLRFSRNSIFAAA